MVANDLDKGFLGRRDEVAPSSVLKAVRRMVCELCLMCGN
jgi:hypothetical protein